MILKMRIKKKRSWGNSSNLPQKPELVILMKIWESLNIGHFSKTITTTEKKHH